MMDSTAGNAPTEVAGMELAGFDSLHGEETADFAMARCAAHDNTIEHLNEIVQQVLEEVNSTAFTSISRFLRRAICSLQEGWNVPKQTVGGALVAGQEDRPINSKVPATPAYAELPVAVIHTDCSAADHGMQMHQLLRQLGRSCSKHIAVLRARECVNLASTIKLLVSQLMGSREHAVGNCSYNLSVLAGWYADLQARQATARAASATQRGSASAPQPPSAFTTPLIVLLEDCERMAPEVLNGLVTACSRARCVDNATPLPLAFILPLFNGTEALPQLLQRGTLVLLRAQRFALSGTDRSVEQLAANLLKSPMMPCLAPATYDLLLHLLHENHYSSSAFVSQLRFCLLHHFRSSPLSFVSACDLLALRDAHSSLVHITSNLTDGHLTYLLKLPSVLAYLRGTSEGARATTLRQKLPELLLEQAKARDAASVARHCLLEYLESAYKGANKHHTSARHVYAEALRGKVGCSLAASLAQSALREAKLQEADVRKWLIRADELISEANIRTERAMEPASRGLAQLLKSSTEPSTGADVDGHAASTTESSSAVAPRSSGWSASKKRRTQLSTASVAVQPGKDGHLGAAAAEWLRLLLSDHADKPTAMPLHELWQSDGSEEKELLLAFCASPRDALPAALQSIVREASKLPPAPSSASTASSGAVTPVSRRATKASARESGRAAVRGSASDATSPDVTAKACTPPRGTRRQRTEHGESTATAATPPTEAETAAAMASPRTEAVDGKAEPLLDRSGLPPGWTTAVLAEILGERKEKFLNARQLFCTFTSHPVTRRSNLSNQALLAHFVLAIQHLQMLGFSIASKRKRGMLQKLV